MEQQMLFTCSTMHAAEDDMHRHDRRNAHAGPREQQGRSSSSCCMQTYYQSSETTTMRPPTATTAAK